MTRDTLLALLERADAGAPRDDFTRAERRDLFDPGLARYGGTRAPLPIVLTGRGTVVLKALREGLDGVKA